MGFFHKLLSFGSRRNKKQRATRRAEARPVPPLSKEELRRQQEEQEEVANRLLRSSSLQYARGSEVDYAALPPLPHPINSLNSLNRRPQAAAVSRSSSIQTRRTYTVTIRDRKVEALTEFPNANPPLETPPRPSRDRCNSSGQLPKYPPVTPKDRNRLHVLRQDPSVASLLDMYDKHGRLDSKAFSNTPTASEKERSRDGRAQVKRSGSTLRQLLGNPESDHQTSITEGDISWAEAFLQESGRGNDESMPSILLEAPTDAGISHFNKPSSPHRPSAGFTTRRAISSMAVEPSYTSEESSAPNPQRPARPEIRPAAEVFGFLLEKRRTSGSMPMSVETTPNVLPVTRGANLPTVTATSTRASRIPRRSLPLPGDLTTLNSETQLLNISSTKPASTLNPTYNNYDILRAATNTITERAHVATSHPTSASERNGISALAPKRSAHRRSASCGPSALVSNHWNALPDTTGAARPKGLASDDSKENANPAITAKKVALYSSKNPKSRLPVTPSHEAALLTPVSSPDSSAELSPLAQRMMSDLRKQRRVRGERRNNQIARAVVHV